MNERIVQQNIEFHATEGPGLLRSHGGWAEVKGERGKIRDRIKGDERILEESEFVSQMLDGAHVQFELCYRLKRMGYDLKKVTARVAELYGMDAGETMLEGRRRPEVFSVTGWLVNWGWR
jgi:hypothetical protein